MVAKRVYEIGDAGALTDDLAFLLDREGLDEAVQTTLASLRAWVNAQVDAQLSASLLASVSGLDVGASTSTVPNSPQGVMIAFDRDTPGRLTLFQYQVGVDPFVEPITMSSIAGVPEWNFVVGAPPVTADQVGVGASIDGTITFSNGFGIPINLVVTPGRAAIIGDLTIANLDQIPLLAPTPNTTVIMEDRGQALRMAIVDYATYVDRVARSVSAMPSSGQYLAGDFLRNDAPAILGTAGARYVVLGWKRLTTGGSHVLNTDWVECRTLTGT